MIKFIKHKRFLDCCIRVDSMSEYDGTGIWWNMGFIESFSIRESAVFHIANSDDWEVFILEDLRPFTRLLKPLSLRYTNWKPL